MVTSVFGAVAPAMHRAAVEFPAPPTVRLAVLISPTSVHAVPLYSSLRAELGGTSPAKTIAAVTLPLIEPPGLLRLA